MRSGDEYRREIWAVDWIPREKRRRSRVAYRSRVLSCTCREALVHVHVHSASAADVRAIPRRVR